MTDKITPTVIRALRIELDAAIASVLEKHGLSHNLGSARYTNDQFSIKLDVTTGDRSDAARQEFNLYARAFGLTPDHFGKQFTSQGRTFTVTGIKPRAREYPILAVDNKGSSYKFKVDVLLGN